MKKYFLNQAILSVLALGTLPAHNVQARSFLTDKAHYHSNINQPQNTNSKSQNNISKLQNSTSIAATLIDSESRELKFVMQKFKARYPEQFESVKSHLQPIAELCVAAEKIDQQRAMSKSSGSMISARYMTMEEFRLYKSQSAQKIAIENTLRKDVVSVSRKIQLQTHWYFSLSGLTYKKQLAELGIQDPKRIKNIILKSIKALQSAAIGKNRNYLECAQIVQTFIGPESAI